MTIGSEISSSIVDDAEQYAESHPRHARTSKTKIAKTTKQPIIPVKCPNNYMQQHQIGRDKTLYSITFKPFKPTPKRLWFQVETRNNKGGFTLNAPDALEDIMMMSNDGSNGLGLSDWLWQHTKMTPILITHLVEIIVHWLSTSMYVFSIIFKYF